MWEGLTASWTSLRRGQHRRRSASLANVLDRNVRLHALPLRLAPAPRRNSSATQTNFGAKQFGGRVGVDLPRLQSPARCGCRCRAPQSTTADRLPPAPFLRSPSQPSRACRQTRRSPEQGCSRQCNEALPRHLRAKNPGQLFFGTGGCLGAGRSALIRVARQRAMAQSIIF